MNELDITDSGIDIDDDLDDVPSEAPTSKLAKWVNTPEVKDLKQDFTDATPAKSTHDTKVSTWLDNLNITGSARIVTSKTKSSVAPKLIRKQAEWRYASLSEPFLSTEDIFNVAPVANDDKNAAIQNALILNNQFNTKLKKVKLVNEYIRTAVNEGTVFCRVGWDYQEDVNKVIVPDYEYHVSTSPEVAQMHTDIQQALSENPEAINSLPPEVQEAHKLTMEAYNSGNASNYEPVLVGEHEEDEIVVTKNQPTVEVCDQRNLTIDPTAKGDLDIAGFIVYSFETSLAALTKEGKYTNLDKINIEGSSSILSAPDHSVDDNSSFNYADNARKKIVAYEYWGYWDINNNNILKPIVAVWVGNTFIRLEENPFPDKKHPFVSAQYLPVIRSNYGEPDGELLKDNQKIVGAVTRGMVDIMGRSANGQTGTRKDVLDITNKRKYDKGEDYEFNPSVDPRQGFYMHTYPEIPNSAQLMLSTQYADAESLSGVKSFASGISGEALGNTATGVRSALDATSKRELDILRRLAEGFIEIGRKIIAMNAVFLSEQEVVRITNEEFVPINRDDLAGNFDLSLSISTAEADNQKAEELAFMLQTTAQSMGPTFAQIILADIARLRKMPELSKRIAEYTPQVDPLEQQKLELEIELLRAQIQEKQANAQLDLARARKESSVADTSDLNYVEQETGVKQERDLQKQKAQSEGNINLELVKTAIKSQESKTTK